ncbi:hypothetical protein MRX96_006196 [Rhipicephalus microplus]
MDFSNQRFRWSRKEQLQFVAQQFSCIAPHNNVASVHPEPRPTELLRSPDGRNRGQLPRLDSPLDPRLPIEVSSIQPHQYNDIHTIGFGRCPPTAWNTPRLPFKFYFWLNQFVNARIRSRSGPVLARVRRHYTSFDSANGFGNR